MLRSRLDTSKEMASFNDSVPPVIIGSPKEERTNLIVHSRNSNHMGTLQLSDIDVERPTLPVNGSTHFNVNVADLTLQEKISLLSGETMWKTASIPRLSIPSLVLSDGPHGVRKQLRDFSIHDSYPATCFPTATALACSWDESLVRDVGTALQKECVHYGVHVLLGPGINLKRHPGGGRNFEYFSEDPVLTGRLAIAYVLGLQSSGKVAACVKHLAVNNQESHRFVVDAIVDERTLRELYYRAFESVIQKARPVTIMCAYNRVNGEFCSEHRRLLNDVLREEWGFTGVTMTDWGATNERCAGIDAGMDLEMPGSHGAHYWELVEAIRLGELPITRVDASVQRMLNLINEFGYTSDDDRATTNEYNAENPMWSEHYDLAYKAAMDCCVLLKNEDSFLPLQADTVGKIAIIGDFCRDHPRYQGMGSSQVHSTKVVTAYHELGRYVTIVDHLLFAPGYHADDDHMENIDEALISEAANIANQADVVLLFIGLPEIMESEGFDRSHIRLPAQHTALVDAVCSVNANVVVILSNGGAVEIPWFHKPKAIFEGYLLGEAGGAAIVDLIFGVQSPCGKLAETIPERVEDILANSFFPGDERRVEYREGLLVGYRYFDTAKKQVSFPFGHGLSYTTFDYSGLKVTVIQDDKHGKQVEVSLIVQNKGPIAGKEVVQCYVHLMESRVFRPDQALSDFAKINLAAGESQEVRFVLEDDSFSFFDIGTNKWVVENGEYEIRIGSSSRDIRQRHVIIFRNGLDEPSNLSCQSYPPTSEKSEEEAMVDLVTFANRFGHNKESVMKGIALAKNALPQKFDRNSLLKEVAATRLIGYILYLVVYSTASKDIKHGPARKRQKRMVKETVKSLPLRSLVLFSRGGISFDTLDACISLMNRHYLAALKGFGKAFCHFVRPKR